MIPQILSNFELCHPSIQRGWEREHDKLPSCCVFTAVIEVSLNFREENVFLPYFPNTKLVTQKQRQRRLTKVHSWSLDYRFLRHTRRLFLTVYSLLSLTTAGWIDSIKSLDLIPRSDTIFGILVSDYILRMRQISDT